MARRRNTAPSEKSALALQMRDSGLRRLAELRDAKIAAMVNFGVTVTDVLDIMLPKSTQVILRNAKGIVHEGSWSYAGHDFEVCPGVTLTVNPDGFACAGLMLPTPEALKIDTSHPKLPVLMQGVREALQIIDDFHVVDTTIRWMDRTMGKGTLRYYFPAIMQLVPDLDQELVERVIQPKNLALHLPAIRASATLLGTAALLPNQPDQSNSVMTLRFDEGSRFERDHVNYVRKQVVIKI